jgi:hypothetical protein
MSLWWAWASAEETGGHNFTENETLDLGAEYNVYASVALAQFNGNGGSPQANAYISAYVQNGNPVTDQNLSFLDAAGISSITLSVTVNNAASKGQLTVTTDK